MIERSSGILMPISSLPSPHGIGTMGKAAYNFADFLAAAGQKYWQLLPLGPTSYGDSPYQSFSSFAGNPYFIDLDLLVKDKLLTRAEVNACDWGDDPRYVDYGKIYASRFTLLEKAKTRGFTRDREAVTAFERENERWLPNYALFMALKRHFGMKSWTEWDDEDIRCRTSGEVIERYRAELREDVELFTYIQFLFFRQWEALKAYIHSLGIRIIGDLPIYVAMDSADVWAEPEMFQLDEHNVPTEVSGVPPDCFSEDGQLWGNRSTTTRPWRATASAGGSAASAARRSSTTSSASTISAASRATGPFPTARRPPKTAAGSRAPACRSSAC